KEARGHPFLHLALGARYTRAPARSGRADCGQARPIAGGCARAHQVAACNTEASQTQWLVAVPRMNRGERRIWSWTVWGSRQLPASSWTGVTSLNMAPLQPFGSCGWAKRT